MVNVVMTDGVRAASARLVHWFYRPAALVLVCAFAAPLPALAQSSWQRYSGTTTVFLPYANAAGNSSLSQTPTVNVGFNGLSHFTAIGMDTGSTGLIASSDIFVPAAGAQNLGPGQQIYSSSGRIENGTWWTATQQFYDATGTLRATTSVPVMQVTSITCTPDARECQPTTQPTGVALMGIGFARESPQQTKATPNYNAFLNLTSVNGQPLPADWTNGYVVTPTGVWLGLTATNTANAAFVKLQPNNTVSPPDWMPAPMSIAVNGVSGAGNILMDTGVGGAFLTPPPGAAVGTLVACPSSGRAECAPNGTTLAISLPGQPNPVASYTISVGQSGNPMSPDAVVVVNAPSGTFFNSSRHVLGGINFIYDFTNGFIAYQWNGGTSSTYGYVTPTISQIPTHDFNGDGKSDILLRDTSGNVAIALMNGTTLLSAFVAGTVPTSSTIVGQRDFNGDGKSDILLRDTSGNVAIALMSGTTLQSPVVVGNAPTSLTIAGTGDFDGDGKSDILLRDTSGNVTIWLMNGTTLQSAVVVGNVLTSWTIAGIGDFNGDGKSDILLRDTSNVAIALISGTTLQSPVVVGTVPTSWTIVGTGDFDGDGKSDILLRDTSGNVGIALINGTTLQSAVVVGNAPTSWTIVETGDFNGDAMSDILLLDTSGNVAIALMNGTSVRSAAVVGTVPASWQIQSSNAD